MNWLTNYVRPKIKSILGKREVPENMWLQDPSTGDMVYRPDVEQNQFVIPNSGHHLRIPPEQRLKYFFDDGEFEVLKNPSVASDPLNFKDEKKYIDRLRHYRQKLNKDDAVTAAVGKIESLPIMAIAQDFAFMGGSLGMATGEAIVNGFEEAIKRHLPVVFFTASGGARMQEGVLSLMQMVRTTIAVQKLKEAGLPYIVVLTHPTTGGVTASYAMLGDIHIAEPGAMIGLTGPRVIQQTIREKLPEGFQTSEHLHKHGMVDLVVKRTELKLTIARILSILTKQQISSQN